MTRWTITLFLTAVLASTVAHGQTTGYINFAFRLFDNGSIVDSSTFFMPLSTRKWKIINDGSHISTIEHYDNKNKIFVASIGVLGSLPFTFSLCRDTINDRPNLDYSNKMTIIFRWDSCANYIYCDSLTFKKDTFYLDNCCEPKDTIDFFYTKQHNYYRFCKIKTIAQKQTPSQPQTVPPFLTATTYTVIISDSLTTSKIKKTKKVKPITYAQWAELEPKIENNTETYYLNGAKFTGKVIGGDGETTIQKGLITHYIEWHSYSNNKKTEWIYKKGKVIKAYEWDEEGRLIKETIYNLLGNIVKSKTYSANKKTEWIYKKGKVKAYYEWNEEGKLIKETIYDINGNIVEVKTY